MGGGGPLTIYGRVWRGIHHAEKACVFGAGGGACRSWGAGRQSSGARRWWPCATSAASPSQTGSRRPRPVRRTPPPPSFRFAFPRCAGLSRGYFHPTARRSSFRPVCPRADLTPRRDAVGQGWWRCWCGCSGHVTLGPTRTGSPPPASATSPPTPPSRRVPSRPQPAGPPAGPLLCRFSGPLIYSGTSMSGLSCFLPGNLDGGQFDPPPRPAPLSMLRV